MYIKHILLLTVIVVLITGSIGVFLFTPNFSNSQHDTQSNTSDDGTDFGNNPSNDNSYPIDNSDWILIFSSNETFVEGDTGVGSDLLKFTVRDVQKLNIKMHIISELCSACGGIGKGEVTVRIQTPSGDVVFQNIYTQTSDLNLLQMHPEEGEWQIFIEGVAVGEDYTVGYTAKVLTSNSSDV